MADPTIALALGAGGARGLAHIHVLEALDDLGIRPVALAGTSIGSIMAAGYASGMSGADINAYTRERFRNRIKLLGDLWRTRPSAVPAFLREGGPRVGEINIERVLDIFLPSQIAADFAHLKIPTQIVATDYYGHRDHVFSRGPLRIALAASAAIPAVFRPIVAHGRILIDGGMTNPTPFDLLEGKADIVVAIDVCGGPNGDATKRPSKIDVMYAASQLMQLTITRVKAENHQLDLYIRPDVGRVRVLDFLKTQSILDMTSPLREDVKRKIDHAMKTHRHRIRA